MFCVVESTLKLRIVRRNFGVICSSLIGKLTGCAPSYIAYSLLSSLGDCNVGQLPFCIIEISPGGGGLNYSYQVRFDSAIRGHQVVESREQNCNAYGGLNFTTYAQLDKTGYTIHSCARAVMDSIGQEAIRYHIGISTYKVNHWEGLKPKPRALERGIPTRMNWRDGTEGGKGRISGSQGDAAVTHRPQAEFRSPRKRNLNRKLGYEIGIDKRRAGG
ncbi:hypothetical protein C8R43DRAFT_959452 [Mycena crocata]|nr:hypothetical protein C8R43DRAFT_959452 [Mycena crocata]